jgi:hypothetical protein
MDGVCAKAQVANSIPTKQPARLRMMESTEAREPNIPDRAERGIGTESWLLRTKVRQ